MQVRRAPPPPLPGGMRKARLPPPPPPPPPAAQRGAELLRRSGVARSVGFVVGLPGESEATVGQTIALAARVRPERLQFTRWTPLPGSPLVEAGHGPGPDGQTGPAGGFHDREARDAVAGWVQRCYRECGASAGWGAPSC